MDEDRTVHIDSPDNLGIFFWSGCEPFGGPASYNLCWGGLQAFAEEMVKECSAWER